MKKSLMIFAIICCWVGLSAQGNLDIRGGVPGFRQSSPEWNEPNLATAMQYWPDQQNIWTPIGWKDHYFRFNVVYNGAVVMDLAPGFSPRKHSKKWLGEDFLLTFHTNANGKPTAIPSHRIPAAKIDGGYGIQGWNREHQTPVLWTEFQIQDGLVIRKEIFAHIYGGADVKTALEPLYAWIRLSVVHVNEIRHPEKYPLVVQMSRNYYDHYDHRYEYALSLDINPEVAPYPKKLKMERNYKTMNSVVEIVEPDGKIRMLIVPVKGQNLEFSEISKGIYALKVDMNVKHGDYIDVLLPVKPVDRQYIMSEMSIGYDKALAESDHYWAYKPEGVANFRVPEHYINEVIDQSVKFASIIAEKDYVTGEYSYHSGSWGYDVLWSTPTSMVSHMFLDQLGYFQMTRKYSELFHRNQGSVKAPGDVFKQHPGYLSSPKTLTSIDWLTDHGAILLQLSTHALLSDDSTFINHWIDPIVKACDFLKESAKLTNHDGIAGLLPPGVATDEETSYQAVWNIAWNYKGLTSAVRLLNRLGHPRAKEFSDFAVQTKSIFVKAYRELSEKGDFWTDDSGKRRYAPPTMLSATKPPYHRFSEAFYLDTGPMVLIWAGLMDAADPLMVDAVDFFRNGPNRKLWGTVYHALWRPFLIHEVSTCEPCYSWNVFASWQLSDRKHYLECMYSLFAGALSQQTYISCEHRHGIQGNLFATPLAFYLARLAVIDEHIVPGELHLLRFCPRSWITTEESALFEKMPTELGPVSLSFKLKKDEETLQVSFVSNFRSKPNKIVLHVPPIRNLKYLEVNGEKIGVEGKEYITI